MTALRLLGAALAIIIVAAAVPANARNAKSKPHLSAASGRIECLSDDSAIGAHCGPAPTRTGTVKRETNGAAAYAYAPVFSSNALVTRARAYVGKTAGELGLRRSLWCGAFMAFVAPAAAAHVPNPQVAKNWRAAGRRIAGPQVGAIAVLDGAGGHGHVGVVSGVTAKGDPIIISGNYNNRVAEAPYPRSKVIAYVEPAP